MKKTESEQRPSNFVLYHEETKFIKKLISFIEEGLCKNSINRSSGETQIDLNALKGVLLNKTTQHMDDLLFVNENKIDISREMREKAQKIVYQEYITTMMDAGYYEMRQYPYECFFVEKNKPWNIELINKALDLNLSEEDFDFFKKIPEMAGVEKAIAISKLNMLKETSRICNINYLQRKYNQGFKDDKVDKEISEARAVLRKNYLLSEHDWFKFSIISGKDHELIKSFVAEKYFCKDSSLMEYLSVGRELPSRWSVDEEQGFRDEISEVLGKRKPPKPG